MLAPMSRAAHPAGRRSRTRLALASALAPALVLTCTACAGIGQPAPYDSPGINGLLIPTPTADPGDFVARIDNPWLALEPGQVRRFEVSGDAGDGLDGTLSLTVLGDPVDVGGISATAVRTTTDIGRGPAATVTDLLAQDRAGNVWWVGADGPEGSWRAGEDGAEAGLAMPADPRLGDGWLDRAVPGLVQASTTIEERTADRVQTRHEADSTTRTVYERGVGLVGVIELDAGWTAVPSN